jgi:hypothetical protein
MARRSSVGVARAALVWGAGAVLVALLGTRAAGAQPLPVVERDDTDVGGYTDTADDRDTEVYAVTLRGVTPGTAWEIYRPEGPTVARCGSRGCTVKMEAGSYRLWAKGTPLSRSRELEVHSDMDLTVRAPSRSARQAGLAVGIVGSAMAGIGMGLIETALIGGIECLGDALAPDNDSPPCDNSGTFTLGLVLAGGGAVLTPVGWVTFARNRYPTIKRTRRRVLEPANPRAFHPGPIVGGTPSPRIELSVQRVGTGYGIGARATF